MPEAQFTIRFMAQTLPDWVAQGFTIIYYLAFHLTKALTAFVQRDSYLYWPYSASTVVIALTVLLIRARRLGNTSQVATVWSAVQPHLAAHLWWHRSARADYRLYFTNALILPILLGALFIGEQMVLGFFAGTFGLTSTLLPAVHGAAATWAEFRLDVPTALLALRTISYTVVFYIAYDISRFVAHSLLHDIPALWEFHKLHHSAEVLTPMTAYRAHPIELLLMAWSTVIATGAITVLFDALTGQRTAFITFLGLHVFLALTSLVDNLRHSTVWLSYGPRWGHWLVSPAHHQLHHSYEPHHMGCNRGYTFALWDRLYGTLYVPGFAPESFRIGLGDGSEARWHGFTYQYLAPFAGCLKIATRRLRRVAS